jgi:hypothetical protein
MSREWAVRLAVVLAAVAVTFGGALFTDRVFYQRDILNYWTPHIEVFVRAVAEGSWPLWNPWGGFGEPLLADPNFSLAYPPTWLNLVMSPPAYYKLLVVSHCAWGGAGVLLLARQRGLGADASLVAASAYCLSGPFLSTANLFHHFLGAAWMPWVLLAFEGLLRAPSAGAALGLGAAAAMQVLAGSGDACLITLLAGAFLVSGAGGARGGWSFSAPTLRALALALVLAVGLSAVQWMPTAELVAGSSRLLPQSHPFYWSLHPASLPDFFAHELVSRLPLSATARSALFEGREPLLRSLYWGPLVVVLALLGAAMPGRGRVALLAGMALFLVAALGGHTPFYALLLHLPLFSLLRFPTKYLWGATLFVALLAGLGASSWARPWGAVERRRAVVVGTLAGLAGLVFFAAALALHHHTSLVGRWLESGPTSAASLGTAFTEAAIAAFLFGAGCVAVFVRRAGMTLPWSALGAVLLLGDLVRAGWAVNPLAPPLLLGLRPTLADTLKARGAPRVYTAESREGRPEDAPVRGPEGWLAQWVKLLGGIERLIPPTPGRWGLYGSFHADFTGLAERHALELSDITHAARDRVEGARLLRLCGVDYVVTLDRGVFGGALPEAARSESVYGSPLFLLSVPDALPRVFVVDGVRPVAEGDAVNVLVGGQFDATREVLLAGPVVASPPRPGFRGRARVLSRRADALSLEAQLDRPGVLVVLESYHPGWRATVDGRPSPIHRANALFRGIPLPAGRHRVEMVFRPRSAVSGAAVSLVSGLFALGLFVRGVREAGRP